MLLDLMDVDKEEMMWCPVRAVKHYLSRIEHSYPACNNLFISTGWVKMISMEYSYLLDQFSHHPHLQEDSWQGLHGSESQGNMRSSILVLPSYLTVKRWEFRIRNNAQKMKEDDVKIILSSLAYITLIRLLFCMSTGERGREFSKKKN